MGEYLNTARRLLCLCLFTLSALSRPCWADTEALVCALEAVSPILEREKDPYRAGRNLIAWGCVARACGEEELAEELFVGANDALYAWRDLSAETCYELLNFPLVPDFRVRFLCNLYALGEKPQRILQLLKGVPIIDEQGYELLGRVQLRLGQHVDALQNLLTACILDREVAPGNEFTLRRLRLYECLGDAFALNGNLRAARLAWRAAHDVSRRLNEAGFETEASCFLSYNPEANRRKRLAASTLLRSHSASQP